MRAGRGLRPARVVSATCPPRATVTHVRHDPPPGNGLVGYYGQCGVSRRGIGRRLMRAAEGWAKAQGAVDLLLDCDAANRAAIRFYETLGYRVRGLILAKRGATPDHRLPD
ncbi:GNAT family N-acetyltransferase [Thermalbibacter longus]|uniref:GNAT family N-acetyltransferase n=1 Tax=Thermalbibacter longus TaxID=2951981 RepID=UPI00325FC447